MFISNSSRTGLGTIEARVNHFALNTALKVFWWIAIFGLGFSIPISTGLTSLFWYGIAGLWGLQLAIDPNLRSILKNILLHPAVLGLLGLVLINLLSTIYSIAPLADQWDLFRKISRYAWLVIFLSVFQTNISLRKIAWQGFMIGMITNISITLLNKFQIITYASRFSSGSFRDTIHSGYLVIFTASIILFYLYNQAQGSKKELFKIGCLVFLFGLIVFFKMVCWSRLTLLLGLAVLPIYWIHLSFYSRLQRGLLIILCVISLLSSGTLNQVWQAGFQQLENYWKQTQSINPEKINPEYSSIGARLLWTQRFWKLYSGSPFFGYGLGSIETVYARAFEKPGAIENEQLRSEFFTNNPHNEYLTILIQTGLLGLTAFWIFILGAWESRKNLNAFGAYTISVLTVLLLLGCCFNSWLMDHCSVCFYIYFFSLGLSEISHVKHRVTEILD